MRMPKILIVDDEVIFANNISKLLSKRGYDAVAAHDGPTALKILDENEFDVLILDLKMPGMHGIDVLRIIKEKKALWQVIILTGHGSVDSAVEGMRLGAFDYATKPINLSELIDKINQAFERKQLQETACK